MTLPTPTKRGYTQRVEVGAYYTDGIDLWEVVEVHDLGMVALRNAADDTPRDVGIAAFRRSYWLAALRKDPTLPNPAGGKS